AQSGGPRFSCSPLLLTSPSRCLSVVLGAWPAALHLPVAPIPGEKGATTAPTSGAGRPFPAERATAATFAAVAAGSCAGLCGCTFLSVAGGVAGTAGVADSSAT